jgi:mannose-6-phosphate isomerase-like protein (cupin superfamily)
MGGHDLETHPIHLGLGGTAVTQPEFPRDERAMAWYMDYAGRHAADGEDGRLVSLFRFTEDWPSWEMHPAGAEVVVCLSGAMELVQEVGEAEVRTRLSSGEYTINPPGVWHTANIDGEASGLFITPGVGTQNRPR